jgi:hypothetical protein
MNTLQIISLQVPKTFNRNIVRGSMRSIGE